MLENSIKFKDNYHTKGFVRQRGEKMTNLIEKSKVIGVDLFKEINSRKENGDTNRSIIDYLKEQLSIVFTEILIENIVQ